MTRHHARCVSAREGIAACVFAVGALVCSGALAQPGSPRDIPAPAPGGVGVQIDLGELLRAFGRMRRSDTIDTEWPADEAALAAYSLPAEIVRRAAPDGDLVCEPGELLVFWPSPQAAEDGLRELRETDQLIPDVRAVLPGLGAVIARYRLPDNETALGLRARLRERHPDWAVDFNTRSSAGAGPRLYAASHLQVAPPAVPPGSTAGDAAGVHVGVIDGPTDAEDDLLIDGLSRVSVLLPGETAAPATHGNAVARLISARPLSNGFAGVAPGVHLHWATVTRLVQGRERSNTLAQVLALDWQLGQQVQLINVSMGGPSDAVLAAAYRRATARPVILLAAAGNEGPTAAPIFPAAYPGVLAVTATDALVQVYAWANQGPQISLAAPGVDVWVPSGRSESDSAVLAGQYFSGTSFASALATGVLARWGQDRLRQAYAEKLTPICSSARDLGAKGKDAVFGCGLVR